MKNILAFSALAVIVLAVVGWYLNWYQISTTPTQNGRHQVTIDFNTPKISHDVREGKEKVTKLIKDAQKQNDSQTQSVTHTPTFFNPAPPQPEQPKAKDTDKTQPFETTEDGFFILPRNFFPDLTNTKGNTPQK